MIHNYNYNYHPTGVESNQTDTRGKIQLNNAEDTGKIIVLYLGDRP
jgi:hypothetical protein